MEIIGHTSVYGYVEFVAEYYHFGQHDLNNFCRAAELYNRSSMIEGGSRTVRIYRRTCCRLRFPKCIACRLSIG